ncbi:MAG: tetratricopeptide repeat protein, partial [Planctomycetia bacterium]|nr:tetratricopeptide repeat protein [Planctomycetia bacterium]
MSADELLNYATELKLNAANLLDYTKVIELCKKAEAKGLSKENQEFCKQLKVSTQIQRGLAITQFFMQDDNASTDALPKNWKVFRSMALMDLEAGADEANDIAAVQLAIGRLNMLPGGDLKKAKKALDTAIKNAADDPSVLVPSLKYRAEMETNLHKIIAYLERAKKLAPDNTSLLEMFARQWIKVKDYEKALALIEEALKLNPENREYQKIKAYALVGLDRNEEAEKLFNKALEGSDKENFLAVIERAEFYSSIGKRNEAIKLFSEMIARVQVPGLYYFRAALYGQDKKFKEALNDLNQCLRIDPNFSEALQLKGAIYLQMEKYDDALKIFEDMLAKKPHDLNALSQVAYTYSKKGNFEKAKSILEKGLVEHADNIELLRSLGDACLMFGKWKETAENYDKILKIAPDDSGVLNNYAWMLATAPDSSVRNGKKALEMAKKAADLSWYKEAHILSTLGAAYAELGDFANAKKWSAEAVKFAEKEKHDRLADLKAELESYKIKKPWREIPEGLKKPDQK